MFNRTVHQTASKSLSKDDPLEALQARLHACEAEAERLRLDLQRTQMEASIIRNLIATYGAAKSGQPTASIGGASGQHRHRGPQAESASKRAPGPVREILLQAKRPIRRKELIELLEAKGVLLPSAKPGPLLSKILSRAGGFRHIENLGYWVNDVPWPPIDDGDVNDALD